MGPSTYNLCGVNAQNQIAGTALSFNRDNYGFDQRSQLSGMQYSANQKWGTEIP